jgi:hypothetical protein
MENEFVHLGGKIRECIIHPGRMLGTLRRRTFREEALRAMPLRSERRRMCQQKRFRGAIAKTVRLGLRAPWTFHQSEDGKLESPSIAQGVFLQLAEHQQLNFRGAGNTVQAQSILETSGRRKF